MVLEQVTYTAAENFVNVEEGVLVQACLAGDDDAWAQLFKRYSRLIYKIPLSFGFPPLEAEEIFQEVAMEIVECLETLQSHAHLHPWIVTIARRVCIRRLRSAKRYTTVDLELLESAIEDGVDSLDAMLIRLEEYSLIRNAVAALEPKCRTLLTELFLKDPPMSHAAVAALLKLPLGSIGPTRARCLEKLREQVDLLSQNHPERQVDTQNQ